MPAISKYVIPINVRFYSSGNDMKISSSDKKELSKIKKGYDKLSMAGKKKDIAMDKAALNRKSKGLSRGKK